jgi:hypothetical protein
MRALHRPGYQGARDGGTLGGEPGEQHLAVTGRPDSAASHFSSSHSGRIAVR